MSGGALKEALRRLGDSGLYGTSSDFEKWLHSREGLDVSEEQVKVELDSLLEKGQFERHVEYPDDYVSATRPQFGDSFSFSCPRLLADSPIQYFRSLLCVFLRQKGIIREQEVDIVIASVEAIENAVKYSSNGDILVRFDFVPGEFRLEIVNDVKPAEPDHDIELGKYDSSRTLMRGMMVMSRLFDDMDIGIDESVSRATFRARKKLPL